MKIALLVITALVILICRQMLRPCEYDADDGIFNDLLAIAAYAMMAIKIMA